MKKHNNAIRIITFMLAVLLVLGMFSGVFAMLASAADDALDTTSGPTYKIITADTKVSQTLTVGKVSTSVTITFNFLAGEYGRPYGRESDDVLGFDEFEMPTGSSFGWTTKTKLKIETVSTSGEIEYYRATLSNVTYNGGASRSLELYVDGYYAFSVPISSKYFRESADGGTDTPSSDIIIQSVTVRNASGQKLESVNEDTQPFKVEVVFYDAGLQNESREQLKSAKLNAFITSAAGFKPLGGTVGTVEMLTSAMTYPRFRATFDNIKSDGSGNSISFRVQYELPEYESGVKGETTAVLFQVSQDKDDNKETTLKPNVIIQEYSYGGDAIVAGSEFNLDMKILNTSKSLDVENVVMTINPANGFLIAAASNTVYFTKIGAGEAVTYSVALRAAAAGNNTAANPEGGTDYSVEVSFNYQYMENDSYVPPSNNTPVKIAIPVVQLDRFSVNEITDYSQYLNVGEEGYISVPIINKGNSTTFNISGSVKAEDESAFVAPVVNFGNLEAGKSGTIDLSITLNIPGEFYGEAIISYEDENMNQKSHTIPFSIMVNEPYFPPPEIPVENLPDMTDSGPGLFQVIFCAVGALFIAAPVALYSIKRVKARGDDDIDEAF